MKRVASFLLESDDTDLIYDLRSKNGRPHDTSLDPLWSELQKYLDDVTAVHERRHSDMLYIPSAKDFGKLGKGSHKMLVSHLYHGK